MKMGMAQRWKTCNFPKALIKIQKVEDLFLNWRDSYIKYDFPSISQYIQNLVMFIKQV